MQLYSASIRLICRSLALLSVLAALVLPLRATDLPIDVQCSPSVIILDGIASGACDYLTVHTDLPLSLAIAASVELNGLPAASVFADSCGNLVAKFRLARVKELLAPPATALTLTGVTRNGLLFEGTDQVGVVAKTPRR